MNRVTKALSIKSKKKALNEIKIRRREGDVSSEFEGEGGINGGDGCGVGSRSIAIAQYRTATRTRDYASEAEAGKVDNILPFGEARNRINATRRG